jgi:hypothetical protein
MNASDIFHYLFYGLVAIMFFMMGWYIKESTPKDKNSKLYGKKFQQAAMAIMFIFAGIFALFAAFGGGYRITYVKVLPSSADTNMGFRFY